MNKNQIMFIVGSIIFVIYVYFYFKIILRQHMGKREDNLKPHDSNDFDGMGNQGRIPDKKPKNRAM